MRFFLSGELHFLLGMLDIREREREREREQNPCQAPANGVKIREILKQAGKS
ncbi:MAG: hypothetical protein LBS55_06185 [Prevotellaceae bacterium]|nr:hypothetical protein [Prevotellaceae bacterium]